MPKGKKDNEPLFPEKGLEQLPPEVADMLRQFTQADRQPSVIVFDHGIRKTPIPGEKKEYPGELLVNDLFGRKVSVGIPDSKKD